MSNGECADIAGATCTTRPLGKRQQISRRMTTQKTIAVVNGSGRQAASLIRVASAVGFGVRAQIHDRTGLVAEELSQLPNVTLLEGPLLGNTALIDNLFCRREVGLHQYLLAGG